MPHRRLQIPGATHSRVSLGLHLTQNLLLLRCQLLPAVFVLLCTAGKVVKTVLQSRQPLITIAHLAAQASCLRLLVFELQGTRREFGRRSASVRRGRGPAALQSGHVGSAGPAPCA